MGVHGVATALLVIASSVLGLVIKNGAPCLEGRQAISREEIRKDDWACFNFCSPLERTDMCRACCLDPEKAVDTGAPQPPQQPPASPTTRKDGDDDKTEKPEASDDKKQDKTTATPDDAEGGEKTTEGGDQTSTTTT